MRSGALLFALLMLAQPLRAERDLLICKISGAVLNACCCPAPTSAAGLGAPCCCNVVHLAAAAPTAQVHTVTAPSASPVAVLSPWGCRALHRSHISAVNADLVQRPPLMPASPKRPRYLTLLHLLG